MGSGSVGAGEGGLLLTFIYSLDSLVWNKLIYAHLNMSAHFPICEGKFKLKIVGINFEDNEIST